MNFYLRKDSIILKEQEWEGKGELERETIWFLIILRAETSLSYKVAYVTEPMSKILLCRLRFHPWKAKWVLVYGSVWLWTWNHKHWCARNTTFLYFFSQYISYSKFMTFQTDWEISISHCSQQVLSTQLPNFLSFTMSILPKIPR